MEDDLSASNFDPIIFVRNRGGDDVKKLSLLRQKILALSEDTSQTMKKNVSRNYTQFIDTAKEISNLENEMYSVCHKLSEQRKLLESMQELSLAISKDKFAKLPNVRTHSINPIDDRRKSMQQLIEKVDGCNRLTENTSRYVVFESDLREMNFDTLTYLQDVHMFLLNDILLITVSVPHQIGSIRFKLKDVYQVEGIAAINLPDGISGAKDVFKLLIFPQQRLFQSDGPRLKQRWLEQIESCKRMLLEEGSLTRQATLRSRFSQRRSAGGEQMSHTDADNFMSSNRKSTMSESEVEWMRELPDELDVCIAQRDFDAACELIAEGREHMAECKDEVLLNEFKEKLQERERQLKDMLCRELTAGRGGPKSSRKAIQLLVKLGHESLACELYLTQRSKQLKKQVKELRLVDVPTLYVQEMSSILFRALEDVNKECLKLFEQSAGCCSVLVVWSFNELKNYVHSLVQHVFEPGPGAAIIGKCVKEAYRQTETLTLLGLDLRFELEKLLRPHVTRVVKAYSESLLDALRSRISQDLWKPCNLQSETNLQKFCEEQLHSDPRFKLKQYTIDNCKLAITDQTLQFSKSLVSYFYDISDLVGDNYNSDFYIMFSNTTLSAWRLEFQHCSKAVANKTQLVFSNIEFLAAQVLPIFDVKTREVINQEFSSILPTNETSAKSTLSPMQERRRKKSSATLTIEMEEIGDV